jgi:hypothetical protein
MFGLNKPRAAAAAAEVADATGSERERPTLRDCAPRWAALTDRYTALSEREAAIEHELHDGATAQTAVIYVRGDRIGQQPGPELSLIAKLRQANAFANTSPALAPPRGIAAASEQARVLVGDLVSEQPLPLLPDHHPGEIGRDRERALVLGRELEAIRDAKKLLLPEIRKALMAGSAEYCKRLLPDYTDRVRDILQKMRAFGDAWLAHQEFVASIQKEGTASSFLCILFPVDDAELETLMRAAQWAVKSGYASEDEIPAEWRAWKKDRDSRYWRIR